MARWQNGFKNQPGVGCASPYMEMLSFGSRPRTSHTAQESGGSSKELSDGQSIGSVTASLGRWIAKLGPDMRAEWLEAQVQQTGDGEQVSTNIGRGGAMPS